MLFKSRVLAFSIYILTASVFLCVLVVSILSFVKTELEVYPRSKKVTLYQYFEKDHRLNVTNSGVVSLTRMVSDIGYMSYFNDFTLKKEILISRFGDEEYQCYGSCFCEDDIRRRATAGVLVKGVSYLLASVSSVAAFKLATSYFTDKCEEKYSDLCEPKFIRSEVDGCEKISQISNEIENDVESREYYCYGNCVDRINPDPGNELFRPTAQSKGWNCNELKREGSVVVRSDELISTKTLMSFPAQMLQTARAKFQRDHLLHFCKDNSRVKYKYHIDDRRKSKDYLFERSRTGFMCTANRNGKLNKNVKCRQISPKPKAPNTKWMDRVWWERKKEWDEM